MTSNVSHTQFFVTSTRFYFILLAQAFHYSIFFSFFLFKPLSFFTQIEVCSVSKPSGLFLSLFDPSLLFTSCSFAFFQLYAIPLFSSFTHTTHNTYHTSLAFSSCVLFSLDLFPIHFYILIKLLFSFFFLKIIYPTFVTPSFSFFLFSSLFNLLFFTSYIRTLDIYIYTHILFQVKKEQKGERHTTHSQVKEF